MVAAVPRGEGVDMNALALLDLKVSHVKVWTGLSVSLFVMESILEQVFKKYDSEIRQKNILYTSPRWYVGIPSMIWIGNTEQSFFESFQSEASAFRTLVFMVVPASMRCTATDVHVDLDILALTVKVRCYIITNYIMLCISNICEFKQTMYAVLILVIMAGTVLRKMDMLIAFVSLDTTAPIVKVSVNNQVMPFPYMLVKTLNELLTN